MNKIRKVILAGNWKMNHTQKEASHFFDQLSELKKIHPSLELILIPSFLSLAVCVDRSEGLEIPLTIAAQNAQGELKGAFTGEVSGVMLKEIGIQTVLLGHSERRHIFLETDSMISKKFSQLVEQGFQVILCIGETEAERKKQETFQVLERQLKIALETFKILPRSLILAYEPVWAIGTGIHATPEEANEAHQFIRNFLSKRFSKADSEKTCILYGGSVTPTNLLSLLKMSDVDGALVGGASLKPESFLALIHGAEESLILPRKS